MGGSSQVDDASDPPLLTLAEGWEARILPDGNAVLSGDRGPLLLSGRGTAELLALLDGTRTEERLLAELPPGLGARERAVLLSSLRDAGLVAAPAAAPAPLGRIPSSRPRVRVLGDPDPSSAARFAELLSAEGVEAASSGPDQHGLPVLLAPSWTDPAIDAFHRDAARRGVPWAVLFPRGPVLAFAAFEGRPEDPCWACLSFWLRTNRPVEEFVRRDPLRKPADARRAPAAPGLGALAATAARELRAILDGAPRGPFALHAADPDGVETLAHPVLRRPQCAVCGDPRAMREQGMAPIRIAPTGNGTHREGGFRRMDPVAAWERHRHLVSPICGPVSQLGPMPGRHVESRPVFVSGFRACPHVESIDAFTFQRVCAGKGRSAAQARASALFEAVERFSGVFQGDEAILRATARALGSQALRPADLQLHSDRQLAAWAPGDADARGAFRLVRPTDDDTPLDWTPGWSLVHDERRWVPFAYCWSDAPASIDRSRVCFTGNGVASGTSREEAILQGLFELVERDAVAVWWYNMLERPGVPAPLLDDPWVRGLVAEYASLGWDLWGLDLTHDLGIPVHAALARSRSGDRWSIGFGCHVDAGLAFQRALTEVNQVFDPRGELRAPWDASRMVSTRFLEPCGASAAPTDAPAGTDVGVVARWCVDRLARAGLDVVAVDKSRPDIGVPVVQMVSPGLRHFWPRFGPGRLYSVPVGMGWRDAPLSEDALNPVPLAL